MKDNKKKIYQIILLMQVIILLGVCALPAINQLMSMLGASTEESYALNDTENYDVKNNTAATDVQNVGDSLFGDEEEVKEEINSEILAKLETMTLEEKIAQLFIISPEALTENDAVNVAGDQTKEALEKYPVGGLFYSDINMNYKSQVEEMLQNTQEYSQEIIGLPMFLGVLEDGGEGSAFSVNSHFDLSVDEIGQIAASNNPETAKNTAREIGLFLSEMGFNFNLSPIADITAIDNSDTAGQTFGTNPEMVSNMVTAQVEGFKEAGVSSVLKYFPGKGYATKAEEGEYPVTTVKFSDYEEQFEVYKKAIDAGAEFVMLGHIVSENRVQNGIPASMDATNVMVNILRNELGFDGLIMTEPLNIECVTKNYDSAESALKVFVAGADIIFMPEDFEDAYRAMLHMIRNHLISEERLDESVVRVLKAKMEL